MTQERTAHTPLDLSATAISEQWSTKGIASLIAAMERCEPWAVDTRHDTKEKAEAVIAEMVKVFNDTHDTAISSCVSANPQVIIEFLGYLRSGRALALFTWLTEVHPSIPSLLINEAKDNSREYGLILIERITTLEKQHLLSRVFSPERIALVLELLAAAGYDDLS